MEGVGGGGAGSDIRGGGRQLALANSSSAASCSSLSRAIVLWPAVLFAWDWLPGDWLPAPLFAPEGAGFDDSSSIFGPSGFFCLSSSSAWPSSGADETDETSRPWPTTEALPLFTASSCWKGPPDTEGSASPLGGSPRMESFSALLSAGTAVGTAVGGAPPSALTSAGVTSSVASTLASCGLASDTASGTASGTAASVSG